MNLINQEGNSAYLLWVDLEMTGLDPEKDVILEQSSILTDFNFKICASLSSRIFHNKDDLVKLFDQNPWWDNYLENKNKFLNNSLKGLNISLVEDKILQLINKFAKNYPVYLAGNSVHADRKFIAKYWPKLDHRLHYRILDVSSFKIIMFHKFGLEYKKIEAHRSLSDIHESIDELKFYLKYFRTNG